MEKFLSENPFRILGLGCNTPQHTLSRKAEDACKLVAVGLFSEPLFKSAFGPGSVSDLPSEVRAMANDPTRRTEFRIMWPTQPRLIPLLINGKSPAPEDLKEYEISHISFLMTWFEFLIHGLPQDAKESFAFWSDLTNSNSHFRHHLANLLMIDDGSTESDAEYHVNQALDNVNKYIFIRTSSTAVRHWQSGARVTSLELVKMMLATKVAKPILQQALDPFVEIGNQISKDLAQDLESMAKYSSDQHALLSKRQNLLESLFSVLNGYCNSTQDWNDRLNHTSVTLLREMRKAGRSLNGEGRTEEAIELIAFAISIARDPAQAESLKHDLAAYQRVIESVPYDPPQTIKSDSPPTKRTAPPTTATSHSKPPARNNPVKDFLADLIYERDASWRSKSYSVFLACLGLFVVACILISEIQSSKTTANPEMSPAIPEPEAAKPVAAKDFELRTASEQTRERHPIIKAKYPKVKSLNPANTGSTPETQLEPRPTHYENDVRRANLKTQMDALKLTMAIKDSEIFRDRTASDLDNSAIEAERTRLNELHLLIGTSDYLTTQDEIARYNERVDQYNAAKDAFNSHVRQFNSSLELLKQKITDREALRIEFNNLVEQFNSIG